MISCKIFRLVHLSVGFSKLKINNVNNHFKFNFLINSARTKSSFQESDSFIKDESSDPFIEKSSKFLTPHVDLIYENLQKCKNSEDIFNIIHNNSSIIKNQHLCLAFKLLEKRSDLKNILNLPLFKSLCNKTLRSIRYFRTNELLIVLESSINFGIPVNTGLMRGILQMIRSQINDLTIDQIITLENLLKLISKNSDINLKVPLINALKDALPILLQIKINAKEYDFRNINTIIKCFHILGKSTSTNDLLNDLLLRIEEMSCNLDYKSSLLLISSFCDKESNYEDLPDDIFQNLLKTSFDIITNEFDEQDNKSKNLAIKLFFNQHRLKNFYHRKFYKKMVSYITLKNISKLNIVDAYNGLLCLTKNDHFSLDYLDMFITLLLNNSDIYLKSEFMSPIAILNAYEMVNYDIHKHKWDRFVNLLINRIKFIDNNTMNAIKLIEIMKILAVLNDYKNVHKLENNLLIAINKLNSKNVLKLLNESLLLLNAGLHFEHKCDQSAQLIKKFNPLINMAIKSENSEYVDNDLLFPFIGLALGGKEFYKKGVWTEYGQYIDYLIILNADGCPISLKMGNMLNLSEIPPNLTKFAIIPLNESDYCDGPPIFKGHINFKLRMLESYGLINKTINVKNWQALSDGEKIPYLMNKINLKSINQSVI